MADYMGSKHPGDKNRFPRLLLLLSPLRSLHGDTLEDLFFSGLIGNIQIDSVIPYILKMEPKQYQNHLGGKSENTVIKRETTSQEHEESNPYPDMKVQVAVVATTGRTETAENIEQL